MPEPTEIAREQNETELNRGRAEWIESLHRAAPGTDWRAIERANWRRHLDRRNAIRRAQSVGSVPSVPDPLPWIEVGSFGLAGRTHQAVLHEPTNRLYLGSNLGGLWVGDFTPSSPDPNRMNWRPLSDGVYGGAFQAVVLNGPPPTLLKTHVDAWSSQIHRSTDGGSTWTPSSGVTGRVRRLLKLRNEEETVFAITDSPNNWICGQPTNTNLLRSRDRGESFQQVRDLFDSRADIWTSRIASGPLYVLTDNRLQVSIDLGATWTTVGILPRSGPSRAVLSGSEAGSPTFYAVVQNNDCAGDRTLFRSGDGGLNWTSRGTVDDFWGDMVSLSASTSNPNLVLYGGTEAWRSIDGGTTFTRVNAWGDYYRDPGHKLHADIPWIGFEAVTGGTELLFVSTDGGTFYSSDGGATFNNMSMHGLNVSQYYSTLSDADDPRQIQAGSQDQGHQKGEAGQGSLFSQLRSGDYGHLTSSDGTHDLVYSANPDSILVAERSGSNPTLYGGFSFPAEDHHFLPCLVADPRDASSVYLCARYLHKYTRSGNNWLPTQLPFDFASGSGEYVSAFAIAPSDPTRWYVATNWGRLFYSADEGASWTQSAFMSVPPPAFTGVAILVDPHDPLRSYVGGSGYSNPPVYRSIDGGQTFMPFSPGLPSTLVFDLAADPLGGDDVYAATESGPYRYDAGSGAWQGLLDPSAPMTTYWSVERAFDRVRFGTYGRGIWDYVPTQAGCSFSVQPASVTFPASGGTGTLDVTAGIGCAWSVMRLDDWIALTGATHGTGNGSVTYSVDANPSSLPRTGHLTLQGQTLTIDQESSTLAVSLSASPASGPAPLNTQLTATVSGTATGTMNYTFWWNCTDPGTSVVSVMAVCGTIPTPSSGSCASNANGIKCDGVTDNPKVVSNTYSSPGLYTAKVIAERGAAAPAEMRRAITVATPTCASFSISPTSGNPGPAAGSQEVTVTGEPAGCTGGSWTAAGNGSWITVSPTSGSGSSAVTVFWTQNTSTPRSGTAAIAGQTFTVSQSGVCSGQFICEDFTATASGWTFQGSATQKLVEGVAELTPAVMTQVGSTFYNTAAPIDAFTAIFQMRLDSGVGPVADGLTFAVVEGGPVLRGSGSCLGYCGTPGRSFAVEFDTYVSPEYNDPSAPHVGLDVNGDLRSVVTTTLSPIVDQGLITVRIAFNNGTVNVYLQGGTSYPSETQVLTGSIPNWTPFSGYFGFTGATGGFVEAHVIDNVSVALAPPTCTSFTINPTSSSPSYPDGSQLVTVTGSPSGCTGGSWTASGNLPWITVSPTSGSGPSGSTTVSWTQNTGAARSGSATIAGNTFTVNQGAAPTCSSFAISPTSASPGAAAGSQGVTVTGSPAGCTGGSWVASGNGSWITVSPTSGSGSGSVTVFWSENLSTLPRTSNATIAGNTFPVNQAPMLPAASINDVAVAEGNSGTKNAVFTLTLSSVSSQTVTVSFATADGTAVSGSDYTAVSGTVTLPPGATTASFTVPVMGDTVDERNEALLVSLSAPVNATLGRATGQVTIVDDDGRPAVGLPILTLPFTITAQGNYCLVRNLSTVITSGAAITINSDFVNLDLKGFKIGGGSAGAGTQSNGVYALNRKNITVKSGNIRGFLRAVFLEDDSGTFTASQGHVIQNLRADENMYEGIHVQGRGNMVRNNQVVTTGGTTVFGPNADAYGIHTAGAEARVLNNDVTDTNPAGAGSGIAIAVEEAAASVVEKNRLANSTSNNSFGVKAVSGDDVLVIGNRIAGTAFGVFYDTASGKYRDNLATGVGTPYTGATDAGNNQ